MKKTSAVFWAAIVAINVAVWVVPSLQESEKDAKAVAALGVGFELKDRAGKVYEDPVAWARATQPALAPVFEESRADVEELLDLVEAHPMDPVVARERRERDGSFYGVDLASTPIGFNDLALCQLHADDIAFPWDRAEAKGSCADVAAGERDRRESMVWAFSALAFKNGCRYEFRPDLVFDKDAPRHTLTRSLLVDYDDFAPEDENWVMAVELLGDVEKRIDAAVTEDACADYLDTLIPEPAKA